MLVGASSGEKCSTSTDKCNHFSIRGFVSDIRRKGNKVYSPFLSDGEANSVNENSFMLPHMKVHRFRRWQCNGCLDQGAGSSQGTQSMAAAVAPPTARSGDDRTKIFPSRRRLSKKPSTLNATHIVGSSSQTLRVEAKDSAKGKSHMKDGFVSPPSSSTLVSCKGMRSHSQKSPRKHLQQEHNSSQGAPKEVYLSPLKDNLNRENTSYLELAKDQAYPSEVASSSRGTSPAMIPFPSNAIACGNLSSSGQKLSSQEENRVKEGNLSQRIPMAPLNGCTKGKTTSQKPGSLQGTSIVVLFSPTNITEDGKGSSSLKISHDRPGPKSRASVMGPPRSYPSGKNSSSQKTAKENGLQIGKRHYAKRTMQPQDNSEGCAVVIRECIDRDGLHRTAVTKKADYSEESVSPKSKRRKEVGSKGKGVANISFNCEGNNLLAKINQPGNEASSSFGKCRDGKAETSTEVVKTIGPHNMHTEHSVPSRESNSGASTSGHIDDDDDDYNDEDYEEEEEEDEGGRNSRPRRAPKIISLKKVMDKADLMKVSTKNRKRKNRPKDMVYTGSKNSNGSPSGGSKRVAIRDNRQENIIISRKKYLMKRALGRTDAEKKKNKKLRPNKSCVASVSYKEKYKPEHCSEQRSQKKRTAKDKADVGNKRWGKRKVDVPGTRDRSPTTSKSMPSGDGKTEIEVQKVVYPDTNIQVSQCKQKMLEENTGDTTICSLAVRGDGRDKAMIKGKEKLVDGIEVAEDSMLHLHGAREGSSSQANSEIQQADGQRKVKDFDINVPAEEVPMDIVELMAKNQLERTRDDVVDKPIIMQEPVISQSRGLYPTNSMAVYNTSADRSHPPYRVYMEPPADYSGFRLAKPGTAGSVRQLSEYFVEAPKSPLLVGYPNDTDLSSNARFAGSYIPQCQDQVPGSARYSSPGSMGASYGHNPLTFRAPDNNIMQRGSSFTRYQGGISSSPLNSTIWPPAKPARIQSQVSVGGGLVNQQMFSSDSDPFRGAQNNQISGPLNFDLFHRGMQNSAASLYSSNPKADLEHSYGRSKQHVVNYLPLKATGSEDLSSNEIIPALQLLNIMHSGQNPSNNRQLAGEVNGNRILERTRQSALEPGYYQYSKQYMAGPHPHFEGCMNNSGGSRLPLYENRGGRYTSLVEKPCRNYATLATPQQLSCSSPFLSNQSAEKMSNVGSTNPLSFPSHGQREKLGSSAQSSSQYVEFRAQKPANHIHILDRENHWAPAINMGQTEYSGPSRWSLEALNSLMNQSRPRNGSLARSKQLVSLPTPDTEVCVVNRNPAEIVDPREASKFTIKPEDLRPSIAKRTHMVL